jgi:hypothetical protein
MFLPRRNRSLEALECRNLLSAASGAEARAPFPLPVESRADAAFVGTHVVLQAVESRGGLRSDVAGGLRGDSAPAAFRTDYLSPRPTIIAPNIPTAGAHDLIFADGKIAEADSTLVNLGNVGGYDRRTESLNPFAFETGLHFELEVVQLDVSAHEATFAKLSTAGGDHAAYDLSAIRPLFLGFEFHIQATATPGAGSSQHVRMESNPQDEIPHSGNTLSVPAITPVATATPPGDHAAGEPWQAVSADSVSALTASPQLARGAGSAGAVGTAVRRAGSLLAERSAIVAILAQAADAIDAPCAWASTVPLVPQLSVDAEQLGQALAAVLADLDDIGEQIAGSLTDGDRAVVGLAAGGAACYVAARRFNAHAAAVTSPPAGQTQARRRPRPWLLHPFPAGR